MAQFISEAFDTLNEKSIAPVKNTKYETIQQRQAVKTKRVAESVDARAKRRDLDRKVARLKDIKIKNESLDADDDAIRRIKNYIKQAGLAESKRKVDMNTKGVCLDEGTSYTEYTKDDLKVKELTGNRSHPYADYVIWLIQHVPLEKMGYSLESVLWQTLCQVPEDKICAALTGEALLPSDFGEAFTEMYESVSHRKSSSKDEGISKQEWDAIYTYMDDGIRNAVSDDMAPCSDEEFLQEYVKRDPSFEDVLRDEFDIEID